jgi:hypothetical protein
LKRQKRRVYNRFPAAGVSDLIDRKQGFPSRKESRHVRNQDA